MNNPLYRTGLQKSSRTAQELHVPVLRSTTFSMRSCEIPEFNYDKVFYKYPLITLFLRFELILRLKGNYLWPGKSSFAYGSTASRSAVLR